MNNYKLLLIGFIFISFFTLQAQDNHDKSSRAVMASTYLPEYTYETLDGEAAAKLILSTFKITKTIPQINIVGSINDRATIEKLVLQLKQLLDNPPTWDELLVLEKDRLLQEDKALRRISKYKTIAE